VLDPIKKEDHTPAQNSHREDFSWPAHGRGSGHQACGTPLRCDFLIDDIDFGEEFD
jgi:hypothetical protein